MARFTAFALALFTTVSLFGAEPAELDRAAAAIAGKEASFVQRFTPKGFTRAQVESGTVVFGPMPKMRWNYTAPEQKSFIFDGATSWFYVPGDRQVTIGRIDDSRKRDLPFLLLGDPAAREKFFTMTQRTARNLVVTTLQPRGTSSLVRSVTVTTTASDHVIQRIEYSDREGNRTLFELSGYHPAAATADTFRFTPPAGVQIVNAQ